MWIGARLISVIKLFAMKTNVLIIVAAMVLLCAGVYFLVRSMMRSSAENNDHLTLSLACIAVANGLIVWRNRRVKQGKE